MEIKIWNDISKHKEGDTMTVHLPGGDVEYTITKVTISEDKKQDTTDTTSMAKGARYVYLQEQPDKVFKTVRVSEHCNVDLDQRGYPIGIEIV